MPDPLVLAAIILVSFLAGAALTAWIARANRESFLLLARAAAEQSTAQAAEKERAEMDARQARVAALIQPVGQALEKFDRRVGELEVARATAFAGLNEQMRAMHDAQGGLRAETARLVRALRQPAGRGQWGEMQLLRAVELAGMKEHVDFNLQVSRTGEDGDRTRPDLIVHLPGGRHVVIDAKTPMDAYLEVLEAEIDTTRQAALTRHARQLRTHIQQLAAKNYPATHGPGPEFVVLFLPSEALFAAALDTDPGLLEKALASGVVLATPTTLIALLKSIHLGWREESLAANAREISALGRRLHDRLLTMNSHLAKLGRSLAGTVDAYNRTIGSFESRVLADARRFVDLGAADPGNPSGAPAVPVDSPSPAVMAALETDSPPLPDPGFPIRDPDDFLFLPGDPSNRS